MSNRRERVQIAIVGVVQGVGFRPFVFRLAQELGLDGWVRNDERGVTVEVEGPSAALGTFAERLASEKPSPAILYAVEQRFLKPAGYRGFEIRHSESQGRPEVWVLPDLATCPACRREVLDPEDRRCGYPFTNCTHCGPRFTIIEGLPYDRPRTSMKDFPMCGDCRREYSDPRDRRFHAQPNACPRCGPRLELRDTAGAVLAEGPEALERAVRAVSSGKILALKGLGGYHLAADAGNQEAVSLLRQRKRRPYKPFAVMYPSMAALREHVEVPPWAEPLLLSPQAPILLLPRRAGSLGAIASSVAPDAPALGVFLPYTPLHVLLLEGLARPIVATSGNLSDEPIQHDNNEALRGLAGLCDLFLMHNRPIVRPADDSVLHVLRRPRVKPQMLRRSRGYAPLPVLMTNDLPPLLAMGGHLNGAFALSRGREIVLSQYLGDMDSYESRLNYENTLEDFLRLYEIRPRAIAHDLHPDYYTTRLAQSLGKTWRVPLIAVQHHHSHLSAVMAENQIEEETLGLTWDGTGYGPDHTVWGGEFLLGDARQFRRVASLRTFRLPGGERAIKEPWRVALSLLTETFGEDLPTDLPLFGSVQETHLSGVRQMMRAGINSPATSSMGRLFDGVSAILGLSLRNTHQAQSAQLLEYAAWRAAGAAALPKGIFVEGEDSTSTSENPLRKSPGLKDAAENGPNPLRLDWRPWIASLVEGFRAGVPVDDLAAAFHLAVANAGLTCARQIACPRVALAGGVFCNRRLTEHLMEILEMAGFTVCIHTQLPPTDGSLAVGQLCSAAAAF